MKKNQSLLIEMKEESEKADLNSTFKKLRIRHLFPYFMANKWRKNGNSGTKAETPVLWPPHAKSWLMGKDSDAGSDGGQEEKGTTEDEIAGWHHWLDGREFEWTPGVGDGQGGLACCNSWGCKESDMTEWLNWTESNIESAPHPISHVRCPQDLIFHKKLFYCFYDGNS